MPRLLILAFLLALAPGIAVRAQPPAQATQPAQPQITAEQARQALDVLQDPQKRDQFITTLEAIAEGPGRPAPAPAPAPRQNPPLPRPPLPHPHQLRPPARPPPSWSPPTASAPRSWSAPQASSTTVQLRPSPRSAPSAACRCCGAGWRSWRPTPGRAASCSTPPGACSLMLARLRRRMGDPPRGPAPDPGAGAPGPQRRPCHPRRTARRAPSMAKSNRRTAAAPPCSSCCAACRWCSGRLLLELLPVARLPAVGHLIAATALGGELAPPPRPARGDRRLSRCAPPSSASRA